jgi:hypothetical protein
MPRKFSSFNKNSTPVFAIYVSISMSCNINFKTVPAEYQMIFNLTWTTEIRLAMFDSLASTKSLHLFTGLQFFVTIHRERQAHFERTYVCQKRKIVKS